MTMYDGKNNKQNYFSHLGKNETTLTQLSFIFISQ